MAKGLLTDEQIAELPYRRNVGIAVFNDDGMVWLGRRADAPQDDLEGEGHWWQMPQGGIDKDEDPLKAAYRELYEETSIKDVDLLAEAPSTVRYDFPRELIGRKKSRNFRGQEQFWFAFRFTGSDADINVTAPGGGAHPAEFSSWRWGRLSEAPGLVVPFKKTVYETVGRFFAEFAA